MLCLLWVSPRHIPHYFFVFLSTVKGTYTPPYNTIPSPTRLKVMTRWPMKLGLYLAA